jgi:alanine-glyoxylate transaminase/serine-glyoxylate transaminase/serine-pyruvate transaminase
VPLLSAGALAREPIGARGPEARGAHAARAELVPRSRLTLEEGLQARYRRHAQHSAALAAGLEALGLSLPVPAVERLPPLTLVSVPRGIDEARVRKYLLDHFSLEIGGGLGKFKGNAWRIGVMGGSATRQHVCLCLSALSQALADQGHLSSADPLAAAAAVYVQGA